MRKYSIKNKDELELLDVIQFLYKRQILRRKNSSTTTRKTSPGSHIVVKCPTEMVLLWINSKLSIRKDKPRAAQCCPDQTTTLSSKKKCWMSRHDLSWKGKKLNLKWWYVIYKIGKTRTALIPRQNQRGYSVRSAYSRRHATTNCPIKPHQ